LSLALKRNFGSKIGGPFLEHDYGYFEPLLTNLTCGLEAFDGLELLNAAVSVEVLLYQFIDRLGRRLNGKQNRESKERT
jgi:hypothetical protein